MIITITNQLLNSPLFYLLRLRYPFWGFAFFIWFNYMISTILLHFLAMIVPGCFGDFTHSFMVFHYSPHYFPTIFPLGEHPWVSHIIPLFNHDSPIFSNYFHMIFPYSLIISHHSPIFSCDFHWLLSIFAELAVAKPRTVLKRQKKRRCLDQHCLLCRSIGRTPGSKHR